MQNTGSQFFNHRLQFANQIRRQNRQQILYKRRNITQSTDQQPTNHTNSKQHIIDPRFTQQIKQYHSKPSIKQQFINYITSIHDQNILQQHFGLISIRKLITQKNLQCIQQVIDAGLIPKLLNYSKQNQYPQLQLQSLWCLANIAAGTTLQTSTIIDKQGPKVFINLLLSQHLGIVQQAIWLIGNIACDSPFHRDMLTKSFAHTNLLKVIQLSIHLLPTSPNLQSLIQIAAWALAAICRTKPIPNYALVQDVVQAFFYLVKNDLIKEDGILGNVCCAIAYYTDKKKQGPTKIDKIQNCINSEVLPKIISYLNHSSNTVVLPCIKILSNLSTGNSQQISYLLHHSIITHITPLLSNPRKLYRKQSCLTLANLFLQPQPLSHLFSNHLLIKKLTQMFLQDTTQIKIQLAYLFANLVTTPPKQKILPFIKEINLLNILSQYLSNQTDEQLLLATLECLKNILELVKNNKNYFLQELYNLSIIQQLQSLQQHQNDRIYDLVLLIVNKYFQLQNIFKQ